MSPLQRLYLHAVFQPIIARMDRDQLMTQHTQPATGRISRLRAGGVLLLALVAFPGATPQSARDPFPDPIPLSAGAIIVNVKEFVAIPAFAGRAARMMLLISEPGTRQLFLSDMNGVLHRIGLAGDAVTSYLDLTAPSWQIRVQADGLERGFQSFAFHPEFAQRGARGFGHFYTYVDVSDVTPTADFLPSRDTVTHDTVLLEWIAQDPFASAYDGGPPRELLRLRQPFVNHNGGMIAFNPLTTADAPDYGQLYVGVGDGGGSGDPVGHAQNLKSAFGKILRIDPLGSNSRNRQYGVSPVSPLLSARDSAALPEIYAYGLRNPQRFAWDIKTGSFFVADIGQNAIEEISLVTQGANLGWNEWEGSFRFLGGQVALNNPREDRTATYPVVEYAHRDQLLLGQSAITGVIPYRGTEIPQLTDRLIFGDNPSGELFYVNADALPAGGQGAIRRIVFTGNKTLLDLIKARTPSAARADLRFGFGPDNRIFLLNKADGLVRELAR